jgi:hypothetical protein
MYTQSYLGEGQSPTGNQNSQELNPPGYQYEQEPGEVSAGKRNPHPASANSILVADCGTVFTKVSLLGLVEGQYRLMARGEAPTTATAPHEDITRGIIQAINEIEFITGRQFISDGHILSPEQQSGDGVDAFVATISFGDPLRLVVLGAVTPPLEALASQAVSGLYAKIQPLPAPSHIMHATPAPVAIGGAAGRPPAQQWTREHIALEWERQVERIRELQPQAALIVGAADGPAGPTPLQEACQLLINAVQELNEQQNRTLSAASVGSISSASNGIHSRNGGELPANTRSAYSLQHDSVLHPLPVLYAGAPQYVESVQRMLSGYAEVIPIDPLVSHAQLGTTSMAATYLYERDVIQRVAGYDRARSWSNTAPTATASSLSSLVRFLAQHYAMNVTAVDVGGATTTVMMAGEQGEFLPMVNYGVGVGSSIGAILQQVGMQRLARWLPFEITEDELRQYVLNRMLHPQVIPTSMRDLQIGQAFAREAIILTVDAIKKNNLKEFDADLILATGGVLSHTPKYGQAALMLLDALQPRGVTSMVLDRTMLISQLGAVATVAPIAAVQVNENDAVLHRLGTCVVPFGDLPRNQVAIRVGVEYSNGRQIVVEVMSGAIEVIPLRSNEQALLTLYPAPTVDVGLGPGERARAAEEIDGGLVGLIIDARGRPLSLPSDDTERRARLLQWMQILGA